MGSLASRPKVPSIQQQPQVIYMPTPVTTTSSPSTTTNIVQSSEPSESEKKAEARTQNLLTRSRGRFGTVTTSFRGLLSAMNNSGQSKTLLGE